MVRLATNEQPGTIIVDTNNKFLYFVEGNNRATRYGVGVGREGFGWSGVVQDRPQGGMAGLDAAGRDASRAKPRNGHNLPAFMKGGPDNPLGARAMYLYHGRPRHDVPHPRHQPALDDRPATCRPAASA